MRTRTWSAIIEPLALSIYVAMLVASLPKGLLAADSIVHPLRLEVLVLVLYLRLRCSRAS